MTSKKLNLKSREAFAELSLHGKKAYLQDVAAQIMAARGEGVVKFDRSFSGRPQRKTSSSFTST